jgi:hypothetical protein
MDAGIASSILLKFHEFSPDAKTSFDALVKQM